MPATEILFYNIMYNYSASQLIRDLEAAKDSDITLRLNTDGGNPEEMFGMIAKFKEHSKGKKVKVDGKAYSGGAFFCCYADKGEVEALDVSEFLIHRAAYSEWFESNANYMTQAMWENLDRINASLRAALEAKIDVEKFEKMKGVTLDQIFSNDSRVDVFLSAAEAKKIGLVDKIVKITPEKQTEIQTNVNRLAAMAYPKAAAAQPPANNNSNQNKKVMNLDQLRNEHPEVYKQACDDVLKQERDRIGAYLTYMDVDPEACIKAIKEGTTMSQTEMAEFGRKLASNTKLGKIEGGNAGNVTTDESGANKTANDAAKGTFLDEVKNNLKKTVK